MIRLTRDGTTEPVSRDQILRRERGQGNSSADHEQDWQPYPVDTYSCYICEDYDHTNSTPYKDRYPFSPDVFFFFPHIVQVYTYEGSIYNTKPMPSLNFVTVPFANLGTSHCASCDPPHPSPHDLGNTEPTASTLQRRAALEATPAPTSGCCLHNPGARA